MSRENTVVDKKKLTVVSAGPELKGIRRVNHCSYWLVHSMVSFLGYGHTGGWTSSRTRFNQQWALTHELNMLWCFAVVLLQWPSLMSWPPTAMLTMVL